MRVRRSLVSILLLFGTLGSALWFTGCGSDPVADNTIQVPQEQPTIAAAVKAAKSGNIILIASGTYKEHVVVNTPDITIRGEDRNGVLLDGGGTLDAAFTVTANRVAIENLTVRRYTGAGIVVGSAQAGVSIERYRLSYVTSFNNDGFGLEAAESNHGLIEHSYVSGNGSAGLQINSCSACDVVVEDLTADSNAVGLSTSNVVGRVAVVDSTFRANRVGLMPNAADSRKQPKSGHIVIAGDVIVDNGNPMTPDVADGSFGSGILVGGGSVVTVVRNRVTGNAAIGIGLISLNALHPAGTRVIGNVLADNGLDLVYAPTGAKDAAGNCFSTNQFTRSLPRRIQELMSCTRLPADFRIPVLKHFSAPAGISSSEVPAPPEQPTMSEKQKYSLGGSGDVPGAFNVDSITLPPDPSSAG